MDQEYVTPDILKGMLGHPDLLIIDVRRPGSDAWIPGAIWQDRDQVAAWGATLPRNKTIVLYCA